MIGPEPKFPMRSDRTCTACGTRHITCRWVLDPIHLLCGLCVQMPSRRAQLEGANG